jgi:hypothetical protein
MFEESMPIAICRWRIGEGGDHIVEYPVFVLGEGVKDDLRNCLGIPTGNTRPRPSPIVDYRALRAADLAIRVVGGLEQEMLEVDQLLHQVRCGLRILGQHALDDVLPDAVDVGAEGSRANRCIRPSPLTSPVGVRSNRAGPWKF